jgi:urease subunit gamma/beta
VEARFDDGTRLVVVNEPFGAAEGSADADEAPAFTPPVSAIVDIVNEASTAIGLTSHIHLAEVNPRLRLDRAAAFGMRLAIPTGETVWIRPQETVAVPVTPIRGARVMVGNTGLIDGPLDDPIVRERALATLRECGYLDAIDGQAVGRTEDAEQAVAAVMRVRDELAGPVTS